MQAVGQSCMYSYPSHYMEVHHRFQNLHYLSPRKELLVSIRVGLSSDLDMRVKSKTSACAGK